VAKKTVPILAVRVLWVGLSSATLVFTQAVPAAERENKEFVDKEYGYSFKYPLGWPIRQLPEGDAHRDVRVMLQGPNGSSFTVIVEQVGKKTSKEEFRSSLELKERVDALMTQTLEQIYKSIAESIKAIDMSVGERRDLSNEAGIRFYLSTLHKMPAGKPIIVAGIHAFPFKKDYAVSFVLSAFWDATATREQEVLTAVFNSFRLVGEPANAAGSEKPNAPESKRD
jgi:hypothetical protein